MRLEPLSTFQTSAARANGEAALQRLTVSVIIPHYNDLENLDLCLSRLEEQTYPRNLVEIVVADNNSRCGFEAVKAVVRDRANIIQATEQGAGPARNAAVEAGTGEVLAFIDSDCVPDPRWIENGVRALESSDIVGGRVNLFSKDESSLTPVEAFETAFAFNTKRYIEQKKFSATCNLFVKRHDFMKIGPFKNQVSEDMEWGHRSVAAGFKLAYADDVVIGHPTRRNWPELARKWRRLTHESFVYHRMQGRSTLSWLIMSLFVLASPSLHVFTVIRSAKLSGISHKLKAIGVLMTIRPYRAYLMLRELTHGKA